MTPRHHSHRLVVASNLVALPPPPVLLSTLPPLDAPPPYFALVTPPPFRLSFAPNGCRVALRITSTSSPSPPPLPLVVSHSCLPQLVVMLSPINLQLCNCHPLSPLPVMVGCCIFCPLHCSPPAFVFSPTAVCRAVIVTANAAWLIRLRASKLGEGGEQSWISREMAGK